MTSYSIQNISSDIFIHYIITKLSIQDIYNISKIKSFKHIDVYYHVFGKNQYYTTVFQNCLEYVQNSSFTLQNILNIIQILHDNDYSKIHNIHQIFPKSTDIDDINTTFYIYQVIGKYASLKNELIFEVITRNLLQYFAIVFHKKYTSKRNSIILLNKIEMVKHKLLFQLLNVNAKWFVSGINLYYIFENIAISLNTNMSIKTFYENIKIIDSFMIYDYRLHSSIYTITLMALQISKIQYTYGLFETSRMICYFIDNGKNNSFQTKERIILLSLINKCIDLKEQIQKHRIIRYRYRGFKKYVIEEIDKLYKWKS